MADRPPLPLDLQKMSFGPSCYAAEAGEEFRRFPAGFGEPELAEFFALWLSLRPETGVVPDKARFTPERLKAHLGYVSLMELESGTTTVRFRLFGTRLREITGEDLTGVDVRAYFPRPEPAEEIYRRFWAPVFDEARPRVDHGNLLLQDRKHIQYRALHVPLADASGAVRFTCFRAVSNLEGF